MRHQKTYSPGFKLFQMVNLHTKHPFNENQYALRFVPVEPPELKIEFTVADWFQK